VSGAEGIDRGLALVTGASSGIGQAFAESLAARGQPLLLVARREARLRVLCDRLAAAHGIDARPLVADLATPAGREACARAIGEGPRPLETAVLNAGAGSRGAFVDTDPQRLADQVQLNCAAVAEGARAALPALLARGRGDLVIVSSAAAWQPIPYLAVYAATKAFELSLAEALALEARRASSGRVRVIAVCPGPTDTEFHDVAGTASAYRLFPQEDPAAVVMATWRALERGRTRISTGAIARVVAASAAFVPRAARTRIADLLHR
jgi:short-subunit dehydrogenase